ncbi:MAG TPA: hypothetical protein VMA09_02835, partial [Candidatus Binataceae bacterium]|nr:hypothetical protein [Candidatus Binataceae bacterium]
IRQAKSMKFRLCVALVVATLCGTAIVRAESKAGTWWAKKLIFNGASDITTSSAPAGLKSELDYRVSISYPASELEDWLCQQLREAGWSKLGYDFLNPQVSSAVTDNWQHFPDPKETPEECTYQKIQDWQNASGDVLSYALLYQAPTCDVSKLKDVQVFIVRYPAYSAKKMMEAAEERRAKHSQ